MQIVEKVVISSHNPDVKIDDHVTARDPRLVLLNQSIRRACGYRWIVAREISPEYLIVIDDDIVLFPWQLKILFESLLEEPKIPHGLSGMVRMNDGSFQFQQRKNIEIHSLTEIYAVTKGHLKRYFELVKTLDEQDRDFAKKWN